MVPLRSTGWGPAPLMLVFAAAGGLAAAESPEDALKSLVEKLREGTGAVPAVLNRYGRLEAAGNIDAFGRLRVHQGLLKAIQEIGKPELAEEADRFLQLSGSVFFPGQVILLKAIAAPRFPAPRAKRVEMLARAAGGREERLSVWGA